MKEEAAEILRRIEICFPNVISALPRVWTLFENIKSFKDVEHYLLKNVGLCPNTYRCYLTAIKQAWEILEGLNPLQWQPIDINMVYEELIKRGDRNTVCLRIRGLKKFCDVISRNVPGYISPFEIMDEKLIKKLNIAKKTKKPGKQLSNKEFLSLVAWLQEDKSTTGMENYAIFLLLITSGLRAKELEQLRWKDLEYKKGTWKAHFTGRGGKKESQEIHVIAVDACREYFIKQYGREPKPEDALFWTYPDGPRKSNPLSYHTLWNRVKEIGKQAREEGIIRRDIKFTPHLLRRSYAHILQKSGMGIKAIREKTRHISVNEYVENYFQDEELASPYFSQILNPSLTE